MPWLTLCVFAVTSAVTAATLAWPDIGRALERSPAILDGELWRLVTTWFVNTDGWEQVAVNSAGLLFFGILVERLAGPAWWIAVYVVAGFAGEVAGLVWQPFGGGNSVAICGLVALFSILMLDRTGAPVVPRVFSTLFWGGLGAWLVARLDIHGAALAMGFVVAGVAWFLRGHRGGAK